MNKVNSNFFKELKLEFLLPLVFAAIGLLLAALFRVPFRSEEAINLRMIPPPALIEKFTFGYKETVADVFWLRVVQDFHICEKVEGGVARVEGVVREAPACHLGWVYKMVDAITTLAPKWKMPYRIGASLLSMVVDDREGARLIFEKGIVQFPTDYNILYAASYHYIWEVKNPERAAELLLVLAKNGGPPWFYSLASKLFTEAGKALIAKDVVEQALKENGNDDSPISKRLRMRLRQANEILAKENTKEKTKENAQPQSGKTTK